MAGEPLWTYWRRCFGILLPVSLPFPTLVGRIA